MRTIASVVVAALATCTLAFASSAAAKTYEVTRTNDPSPGNCTPSDCSLREAVLAANASVGVADKILLPNRRKPYRLTQSGTGEDGALDGDLDVTNNRLTIVHPRRGRATIDASAAGERALQGFAPLALKKLVLTGGTDDGGGALEASDHVRIAKSVLQDNVSTGVGGAIDMDEDGTLRIIASVLRRNAAENTAGAIRDGEGLVTILRSKFLRNGAENDGGAIRFSSSPAVIVGSTFKRNRSDGGDGGAIESDLEGPLTIRQSTFTGNRTGNNGGAVYGVGASQLRIVATTLSGNRAGQNGGGVYIDGPPALIVNSTVDGNRANTRGGGIHAQDGADLTLNAVTVTRNVAAADDEGIALLGGGGLSRISSAGFDVRNSLIALNTVGADQGIRNDCAGDTPFDSLGNNLLSSPVGGFNCEGFDGPNDIVRAQPKIGKLKNNGGPTKTVALKAGSAAIGHAHKPSAPNRDQRGRKRDADPDSGAFERGA